MARIRGEADGAVTEAVSLLLSGGLVAVPTETVYGLAANALDASATAEVFRVKGRPLIDPLIVPVPDRAAAEEVAVFHGLARRLADAFWPGPVTFVLPRRGGIG